MAILPALAGVLVWKRAPKRRALWCGLLIGAGALLKTVPLLLVLALLPTARSMRERVTLVAASLLLPATSIVPFVVADPAGVGLLRQYSGVPGMGGLTLLVQPGLARAWVAPGPPLDPGSTAMWLVNHGSTITAAAVLAVSLWLFRNQADAVDGSILILLTVDVSGAGFAFQYLVWLLPFLLVAGRLGMTLAVQVIAVVPAVLFYSQLEVRGAGALRR